MTSEATSAPVPEARVLVVDDEEDIRSSLGRFLSLVGYQVDVAASGAEALAKLKRTRFDVAVVDIRMPGMDGVEFVHAAQRRHRNLEIVFLTGYATLDSAIAALRTGAADYLLKPAGAEKVANAVAAAVRRGSLTKAGRELGEERYLRVGSLVLDRHSRVVTVEGRDSVPDRRAKLTQTEAALFAYMMQHPRKAISCQELAQVALRYDVDDWEAGPIIRPHISRIRSKIELDPTHPRLLLTVPGSGYCIAPHLMAEQYGDGRSA